jgi:hypothetical protein
MHIWMMLFPAIKALGQDQLNTLLAAWVGQSVSSDKVKLQGDEAILARGQLDLLWMAMVWLLLIRNDR